MRTVVIGGTGHIGTYLVPRLVEAGHEVVSISRGQHGPFRRPASWRQVTEVVADRDAEDAAGIFASRVRDLRPDVVIDLICFEPDATRQLIGALRGRVRHFLHCGTLWVHGVNIEVPAKESQPRHPIDEYGVKKAAIEAMLLDEAQRAGFPATVVHPGHIVGEGWNPINPVGNWNPQVFVTLARGDELTLPNNGQETMHHVHADDIAQLFELAINHHSLAVGESFHALSPAALTMRGYASAAAAWFGQEANLRFLPWEEWRKTVSAEDADLTWGHIAHSTNGSIAKAQHVLRYQPRYSSLQAIRESVSWLIEHKAIEAPPIFA